MSGNGAESEAGDGAPAPPQPPATHPSPTPSAPALVPRWVQLAGLPVLLLALWALAAAGGTVLVNLIVASVIALILNPLVSVVQGARMPRGLAVLLVYVGFFLVVAFVGLLLANPISSQIQAFIHHLPHIVAKGNKLIANIQSYINRHGIHLHLIKQGKTALETLEAKITKSGGSIVSFGGGLLTDAVKAGFDIVVVFVLSVYMLVYGQRIGALVRSVLPPSNGSRGDDYPTLVQAAVSRYIGGQLLFSIVMGTTAGVALYLFGLIGIFPDGGHYAIVFAVFFAVMELVPYIGPFLGALPPILVALFTEPLTALWVSLLFVAIQQLEGHIVAPQIFGHSLRINPLLVIVALLFGVHVDGVIGALLALPLISILRETVLYLRRHVAFEPWDRSPGGLL